MCRLHTTPACYLADKAQTGVLIILGTTLTLTTPGSQVVYIHLDLLPLLANQPQVVYDFEFR